MPVDGLSLIRLKIQRAEEHMDSLRTAVRDFLSSNPYSVAHRREPNNKLTYFISAINFTPDSIALIAGDVIQNLRDALDHLAFQLYLVNNAGNPSGGGHIYFPVEGTAQDYAAKFPDKTIGMRQDAINAFQALQPYRGGREHDIWVLSRLNNQDKHRTLITVGSQYRSADISSIANQLFQQQGLNVPIPQIWIRPANTLFPLKVNDVLFTSQPGAQPGMSFRFEVAFNEPGVVHNGEPLVESLQRLHDSVSTVITNFAPMLV